MGVHGGKFAVVNNQASMRSWTINDVFANPKAVASNTKSGHARRQGIHSWTGSFMQYGTVPTVLPGEKFTFTGFTCPTDDVSATGEHYTGTAIVDSIAMAWDWKSGAILSYTTNFSGHLGLTKALHAVYTDSGTPIFLPSTGTKITYDASGDVTWANLVQATLTINAANVNYVNSSTAGETGRSAGPIDWTLAVTEENEAPHTVVIPGAILKFKVWVDDTNFWALNYGRVAGYSNLKVDRETQAIIQKTVNIEMAGYADAGTAGLITLPGAGSNWWDG